MVPVIDQHKSQQVYEYIRTNRERLKQTIGNHLPTEEQLSRTLLTDRFSLRRALRRLVEDGLLHSVRNRGYYFDLDSIRVPVARDTSYHKFCDDNQLPPRVEVLEISVEYASPELQSELAVGSQEMVWNILFLRHRGELPFCLTRSWLPRSRTPGLIHHLKNIGSLYKILSSVYGIVPARRRTVCSAVNAGKDEARHLELPISFALLKASSSATDSVGQVIEYCESLYRGDIISLSFNLEGEPQ